MRIQQSIHNKIKKGIVVLLSGIMAFGMAAGIIPGGVEKTLYVQAAGNQPSVMSLSGIKVTTEGKPADVAVKTINLNAAVLRPDGTWSSGGNQVYFGTYSNSSVKYRVLSSPDTMSTTNKSLLLDCSTMLETKTFDGAMSDSFYTTMFSNMEMGAIETTALNDCQYSYTMNGVVSLDCTDNKDSKHVFCLSIAEADTLYKDDTARKKADNGFWWLRSRCKDNRRTYTGGVNWSGEVSAQETDKETDKEVSPALNVRLSSVLLASVSGSTAKSSALAAVTNSTATEWKLTLLDKSKSVSVAEGQNVKRQGTTITVPYTYTGSDVSQISIMITNKAYGESNAQVLYYGKLKDVTTGSTTGTGTFTLPADLASQKCGTDYYAYIIAEDINGETTTDYASVPAQINIPDAPASITQVDITGIAAPVAGQPLDIEADCTSEGVKNTLTVTWEPNHTTAKYGTSYTASVKLEAEDGYEFAHVKDILATVNGVKAHSVDVLGGGTYRVRYTFSETAKAKLLSITDPYPITVPHGTAYADMPLPTRVEITTEGNTVDRAAVVWDTSTPASGSYDPSVLTEQTVTLNGTVTCPDNIVADGVSLTTSITITVNAADTVATPTANIKSGTYTVNQTVTLSSVTEGADIYYTTGAAPKYSGKRYTEGILVKAAPGQIETTILKAFAVKSGMQDSAIATFTYTIDLTGGTSEEQAPTITSQPQDAAVKTGERAVFTVGATGTNLTYQWQINRNNGIGFANIDGANSASYTTDVADMSYNGFRYQCVVSNSAGSDTSNVATLTVTEDSTPSETTHIIRATAGEHGSITPSGNVEVKAGESQSFVITADEGYEIETLLVDGSETEIASSYTFENVTTGHSIEVTFKQKGSTSDPEKTDPNPAEKPKQEAEPADNQAPQHEHNFRWVTVQTASAAQDGLEELRCDCGMVMESSVVPASRAYVNELCQNLAAAMENGSVTFDSGRIYTISDYIIKRLRDRADVTTTITFEYNHSQYRMIIPAGVDYTELLEDQDYFYGYFYFAKKVGAKVENL